MILRSMLSNASLPKQALRGLCLSSVMFFGRLLSAQLLHQVIRENRITGFVRRQRMQEMLIATVMGIRDAFLTNGSVS